VLELAEKLRLTQSIDEDHRHSAEDIVADYIREILVHNREVVSLRHIQRGVKLRPTHQVRHLFGLAKVIEYLSKASGLTTEMNQLLEVDGFARDLLSAVATTPRTQDSYGPNNKQYVMDPFTFNKVEL